MLIVLIRNGSYPEMEPTLPSSRGKSNRPADTSD